MTHVSKGYRPYFTISFQKDDKFRLHLVEENKWRAFLLNVVDKADALTRHRLCGHDWYTKFMIWSGQKDKELLDLPLTDEQVQSIDPDGWGWYFEDDEEEEKANA